MSELKKQLLENQAEQFDQNMAIHTLVGNLSNWRDNFTDSNRRQKIFVGHAKIMNLLARFQPKKS